jgi:uncharacterized membrane protein
MSNPTRWLAKESERWVADAIITPEQAARIRQRYAPPASAMSLGLVVFFGLGAVVIGLGIILLLAYNWADIPKFGKLALILGSVAAAHAGGYVLRFTPDWRSRLGEALSLLGTMLFGAGIWLVAQLYNIDEHFPNGFLIWALGALALAWTIESIPQAMLAAVLLGIWAGAESLGFSSPRDISALLLVLAIAPLAWKQNSRVLLATVLAVLYWLLLCNAAHWGGAAGSFANAIALSVLLIAAAKFTAGTSGESLAPVLRNFGLLGFTICAYLLTFHEVVDDLLRWTRTPDSAVVHVYRWVLFLVALGAWGVLLVSSARHRHRAVRADEWLFPIALLYAQAMGVWGGVGDTQFVAIVFNLICLGIATAWMVRGCRHSALGLVVRGSVLLALVVFARYFDLFSSLAVRGLVFVIFGGILFAEGFFYRRIKATSADDEEDAS